MEIKTEWTPIPTMSVGHWTEPSAATGCTVVLTPAGATAGVDVRGTAPATRETDLLDPVCMVQEVHGILIGGGSAFGLAAADGVMQWLATRGHGFNVGVATVPIVPAACLFDLTLGAADRWPDAAAGYAACEAAMQGPTSMGNVGAGTGATVGKLLGPGKASKGGLGMASAVLPLGQDAGPRTGAIINALAAVNAFGEVMDPATGRIVAGVRDDQGSFVDALAVLTARAQDAGAYVPRTNTTLGVIATNVQLSKAEACKVAQMAHDGLARTIRPAHTHFDGDAVFVVAAGNVRLDLSVVGAMAAEVMAAAILAAVQSAGSLHGIPAANAL